MAEKILTPPGSIFRQMNSNFGSKIIKHVLYIVDFIIFYKEKYLPLH